MVGVGWVESELDITKMREIHKDWWMLFAGNDLTPVFDIVDYVKERLPAEGPATIKQVEEAVKTAVAQKRIENAEALYLTPIGWDIARFNSEETHPLLPNSRKLHATITAHTTPLNLLIP